MKLNYGQYLESKEAGCLGKWCLFSGPEQHLKRDGLQRVRQEARGAGGEEPSWEVLDGKGLTVGELLGRCQTGALFGGARVIVVRQVEDVDASQQKALAKVVGPLPAGVAVVLVTGDAEDRRRPRAPDAALSRAVERKGLVVHFAALNVAEATSWATAEAQRRGKRLEPAAARKLVQQKVGTGLAELEAEIEKLALFVGDLGIIAAAHVDEVTPRLVEDDIFRLVDAVGRREAARAVSILRTLLKERREAPGRILWMLAEAIRLVWQTKMLVERGWRPGKDVDEEGISLLPRDERRNALAVFGRRSWLAARTVRQAKAFSWAQLARAIEALRSCDLAMKGIEGKVTDNAAALELVVVQLCSDVSMPVWEGR